MQHLPPAPRALTDAATIAADPGSYADRPLLAQLARLALMTARGTPLRQTGDGAGRIALRVIEGGLR
ncbi:hypothetical protein [Pseudoroseicyclus aestuarii]|uniref:Uncharacterized protein n=1 Tax=Pseudoroseicyclus aestuarii TaxID=1795041 RepID=A0A318SLM6_9RHOB|nr:hypothetical protein [Pseudoroseicyclus aestuarii]PYE80386.1 hypothetical protein DFP88_1186 [Pseudoroseicyclus aestuarii]